MSGKLLDENSIRDSSGDSLQSLGSEHISGLLGKPGNLLCERPIPM